MKYMVCNYLIQFLNKHAHCLIFGLVSFWFLISEILSKMRFSRELRQVQKKACFKADQIQVCYIIIVFMLKRSTFFIIKWETYILLKIYAYHEWLTINRVLAKICYVTNLWFANISLFRWDIFLKVYHNYFTVLRDLKILMISANNIYKISFV